MKLLWEEENLQEGQEEFQGKRDIYEHGDDTAFLRPGTASNMFGIPIADLVAREGKFFLLRPSSSPTSTVPLTIVLALVQHLIRLGGQYPIFLEMAIQFLSEHKAESEVTGLFRLSGDKSAMDQFLKKLDQCTIFFRILL